MTDANIEVLQSLARRNFSLDLQGAAKVASGINSDLNGISRQLYGAPINASFASLVTLLGGRGTTFNATVGMYWETTDKAALNILGDIDIRAEIESPVASGANKVILSKYNPGSQQAYEWRYNGFGFDELVWATTIAGAATTDTLGQALGLRTIRVNMDVDDGAGNRVVTWYSASPDNLSGTYAPRAGSPKTTAGITSIAPGTAPLRIGARADATGSSPFLGRINRVELRNSAGTVVANPDFRFLAPGTTNFVDAAGNTWNAVGGAAIT